MNAIVPVETITSKIYMIRGHKVILDRDLAQLYGVETGQLKRAVRRNIDRFPQDFMFELTKEEHENLRCQFGTSSWGGTRYLPMAFTEQGVAMLSSVLGSKRAIQVRPSGEIFCDFLKALYPFLQERANWISQFVISNADRMGLRHPLMIFAEQGVGMLSSVSFYPFSPLGRGSGERGGGRKMRPPGIHEILAGFATGLY